MFITGRKKNVNVNGPKNKIKAYLNALVASKDLYEVLNDKKSTLSEIRQVLKTKNRMAKIYKKTTGVFWPL